MEERRRDRKKTKDKRLKTKNSRGKKQELESFRAKEGWRAETRDQRSEKTADRGRQTAWCVSTL